MIPPYLSSARVSLARAFPAFFSAIVRRVWLVLLIIGLMSLAHGAGIDIRRASLQAYEDAYAVSAEFEIHFNTVLEEAVDKGIVLFFTVEFELSRSRWYWFDEQIVKRRRTYQLSYHALTRQYRLSSGALHQAFASLEEALSVLSRLRNWPVLEKTELRSETSYLANVRLFLDLTQMPKTFQVSALANREWNLSSEWRRWNFTLPEPMSPGPSEIAPPPAVPPPASPSEAR